MPRQYTDEHLSLAIAAVKKGKQTLSKAAREYHVPRTTLFDHLKHPEIRKKKGPMKELTKEESDGLVEFVLYMAGQGFPMTRKMVRCYVQEMFKSSGRTSLFNLSKGPSDKWFRKLKVDYPQLAFRKPQSQDRGRSRMSNRKVAGDFFLFWKDMLDQHSLSDKPSQIFNCDETGWSGKESGRGKVLGQRTGYLYQQKPISADHMTAHLCVSADGRFIPTMIIFKGSLPHRSYRDGLPGSWLFSTSESGYMDSELFFLWFERIFVPNCGRARPVILLMDNHDSHISLPLVEKAREEQVLLVGLPSHSTHYLQPLDVHVIGPVKEKVTSLASIVGFSKPHTVIGKARLPILLGYAIDQTPASTVKEAFRLAGIMPVNPDVIDQSQLVPPSFEVADEHENETVRTCETCGQYIGQNPLVKRGMIPASLAEVLVPPPVKPQSEKRKRKVVTSGRVISGDEMLQVLKKREEAELRREEEKKKRQIEREARKEQKELEQEMRVAKRQKKEEERNKREQEKLRQKEKKMKYGKLAEKKYTCGMCGERGRVNDELNGVKWYGCDNEGCKSTGWYHYDCLSEGEKNVIRESLEDEDVSWYCKTCFPRFYEEV